MAITIPAVVVIDTIRVVVLPRIEACKVFAAVIARPVGIGGALVLLQGAVVRE